MGGDAISVVETAYDLSMPTDAWLLALTEHLEPLIGGDLGVLSISYELDSRHKISIPNVVDLEVDSWRRELMIAGTRLLPSALFLPLYTRGQALTTPAASLGATLPKLWKMLPAGFERACRHPVLFNAFDPSGLGICISSGHTRKPRAFDATTRQRWNQVAAHICAGMRLRTGHSRADAIFDPLAGKVVHAESSAANARDVLQHAAKQMDRARSRGVSDEECLELWTGLVDGTWSLVEAFESDGRRYLVARRNSGTTIDPRQLSTRQRQVTALAAIGRSDKIIAYSLGISVSATRSHLRRAMRRLGVGNRRDLLRFVRFQSEAQAEGELE